jgi:hypothetical protein
MLDFEVVMSIWNLEFLNLNLEMQEFINSYLRTECEKKFYAHERIIWGTSNEGASASFAGMCRIRLRASKFVQLFFETNIMSDLSCILCE